MNPNLDRYDLSRWLIHFTRPLDLEKDDCPPELPDEWGFGEDVDDTVLSPFFLLRRILRKRQILSTWSIRGGKPTIYGPVPAVCFSEMPLAAFLQASEARAGRGENVSPYAVLIPRVQAFNAGARPVIYGLSDPSARAVAGADGTRRFPATVFSEIEQYRYVAFDPASGRLDWSHEREWRWPNPKYQRFKSYDIPDENSPEYAAWEAWDAAREKHRCDGDGLCLDTGLFDGIGFLVRSERQAKLLMHDILHFVDARDISRTLFSFILRHDALPDADALVDPASADAAIRAASVPLAPFFAVDQAAAAADRKRFDAIVKDVCRDPRRDAGECGGCWLWLRDNAHRLTRSLLSAPDEQQRVLVSRLGRYLVWMPELGDDRGLRLREELTEKIAKRVSSEFGAPAARFSVLNSDDIDGLPSYTDDPDDDGVYSNYAHEEDDF